MERIPFNRLKEELNRIPVFESRIQHQNLQEFVISTDFIMQLHVTLQKFFGEDFKAPGEIPSLEDKRRTAQWGGVRPEQTMYYSETEGCSNCALIWPWADGSRCTVKIAQNVGSN